MQQWATRTGPCVRAKASHPPARTVSARSAMLQLQRAAGNRATAQLVAQTTPVVARAFDPQPIARQLQDAMEGWGTDEDKVYAALGLVNTSADMDSVVAAYSTLTGRSLEADIRDEFSGVELRRALDSLNLRRRTEISETTDTGNEYTQELLLDKGNQRIEIQLGVAWKKEGTWADDAAFHAFVRRVKTAAYSYLDNKFKVVCRPSAPGAGSAAINLPITLLIYDDPDGYEIEAHGGSPGGDSFMSEGGGEVYELQSDGTPEQPITYAHEMSHSMLGASDEYANPEVPGRVLTNDHSLMANYWSQGVAQAEIKARHFQHVVAEVATAFAGYTCTVEAM